MQSSPAVPSTFVRIRPMVEEKSDEMIVPKPSRESEGCAAPDLVLDIDVGTVLQECLDPLLLVAVDSGSQPGHNCTPSSLCLGFLLHQVPLVIDLHQ